MSDNDITCDIRALAENYVREFHSDEWAYFSLTWNTVASRRATPRTPSISRWKWLDIFKVKYGGKGSTPLPVAAITLATFSIIDELQRTSSRIATSDFIPMIRACAKAAGMPKKEASHFEQYMAPRIQQQYARFTATAEEVMCANVIDEENSEAFWVWTNDGTFSKREKGRLTREEIDAKYRGDRKSYDLFLDDGLVSIKQHDQLMGLVLKSHMYDVLLLLLIRRGTFVSTEELFRRAWGENNAPAGSPSRAQSNVDPRTYLKTYVKRLRDKLCTLPGFDIVTDKGMGGSALRGEFRFCVVLPVAKAGRFIAPLGE